MMSPKTHAQAYTQAYRHRACKAIDELLRWLGWAEEVVPAEIHRQGMSRCGS